MAKVALVRCDSYDEELVQRAVEKGVQLIGGVSRFISKGENIVLKPNLLVAEPPEKCVTTHPAVFQAVARVMLQAGVNVTYGDSPAVGRPARVAKKAGLVEVAESLNIDLADFSKGREVHFEKAIMQRKFTIANGVLDSDGVVSIPKLKTHGLEKFTGAIKNQFGCIPGMRKGEFHLKLPGKEDFSKMLVDLNRVISPRLYIMDGITAMEGNGPRGGTPKQMNLLLFSSDPVALDATVCRLLNVDPEYVLTTKYGMQSHMGTHKSDDIELLGDDFDSFRADDFNINRKPIKPFKRGRLANFLNNRLVAKPVIKADQCVKCGMCVSMCPADPKAVVFEHNDRDSVPVYHYEHCIKCYCCQELCPESAIHLKTPLLRKIMNVF